MSSFIGFDLGTTNSAAAVFSGDSLELVRPRHGGLLTPSCVRIARNGKVVVGQRAFNYLSRDPDNTHSGFKRLMGADRQLVFPACGQSKSPVELSALVLKSLLDDVEATIGYSPNGAVIATPALFDVPQSSATVEAAKLAGLQRVELIQEPVASAIAAGWNADHDGVWLVFDLGGGTFDVTAVQSDASGVLRIVAHDGDNFLGGRDFDKSIAHWCLDQLGEQGLKLAAGSDEYALALAKLSAVSEEAKIELSTGRVAEIALLEPLEFAGREWDVELELDRPTLDELCSSLVDKTVTVCHRLLDENNISRDKVTRVVMVGGPSAMPMVRAKVQEHVGEIVTDLDPMTLVAKGAALFAASSGVVSRTNATMTKAAGKKITLDYPTISGDLHPSAVGKLVDSSVDVTQVECFDDSESLVATADISEEGIFVLDLTLKARAANRFTVKGKNEKGETEMLSPNEFTIVHGVTISSPPLSQSIGVALASNGVREYFGRGTPLPMKRTFVHSAVDPLGPEGAAELRIPIVQGEFEQADLCQSIGTLVINGSELNETLPVGAEIELTLSIDRGGRLSGTAHLPAVKKTFDHVTHLLVPDADLETLRATSKKLRGRLGNVRRSAFTEGDTSMMSRLEELDKEIFGADLLLQSAGRKDDDGSLKAAKSLSRIDAELVELELSHKYVELLEDAESTIHWSGMQLHRFGSEEEKKVYERDAAALRRAIDAKKIGPVRRLNKRVFRLGIAAYRRDPEYWFNKFEQLSSRISEMQDTKKATTLVNKGKLLVSNKDEKGLRPIVESLWGLLPPDSGDRARAFNSGVR